MRLYGYDENDPQYNYDISHIPRWMCAECGLIFDFKHDGNGENGWPEYNYEALVYHYDENGEPVIDDDSRYITCPRCGINIDDKPLIPIIISTSITIDDIVKNIINKGEGEDVEFKSRMIDDQQMALSMMAFANANGGKILFGVENGGYTKGIENISTIEGRDKIQGKIRHIANEIDPPINYNIVFAPSEISPSEDRYIMLILIHKGRYVHSYNGTIYIRDKNQKRPANILEITQLFEERKPKSKDPDS